MSMSGLSTILTKLAIKMPKLPKGLESLEKVVNKVPASMKGFQGLEKVTKTMQKSKFKKAVKGLAGMYMKMMVAAKSGLMDKLSGFMSKLSGLSTLFALLSPILAVISAIFAESMKPVLEALMPLMQDLAMWMLENKEAIMGVIMVTQPLVLVLQLLAAAVSGNWEQFNWFYHLMEDLWSLMQGFGELLSGAFWNALKDLKNLFTGLGELLSGAFWNALNDLIGLFENLADLIPSLPGGGGGGGGGGEDIGGGIINPFPFLPPVFGPDVYKFNEPQLIGVGNEAFPEFLMGEPKLKGLLDAAAASGGGMSEEYLFELVRIMRGISQRQESEGQGSRRVFG